MWFYFKKNLLCDTRALKGPSSNLILNPKDKSMPQQQNLMKTLNTKH